MLSVKPVTSSIPLCTLPIAEVKVLRFAALSQQDDGLEARERSTLILDAPCEERFTVAALVVHIAVSSDDLTLSIVTDDDAALHLLLFDLRTFAAQVSVEYVYLQVTAITVCNPESVEYFGWQCD